jgi:hypothetical protein
LRSHRDALVAEWKRDRACGDGVSEQAPPAAGPPVVCMHTTSGTGKTAALPSCPTSCCCAPITGCIIGASSPSPEGLTTSRSPTVPVDR